MNHWNPSNHHRPAWKFLLVTSVVTPLATSKAGAVAAALTFHLSEAVRVTPGGLVNGAAMNMAHWHHEWRDLSLELMRIDEFVRSQKCGLL